MVISPKSIYSLFAKGVYVMDKKSRTSLEVFFDSLGEKEKELLLDYMKDCTYESLSNKFDTLLNPKNES